MVTERLNDIKKKNNFYKHMLFKFFIILFGNIINGFFSITYKKENKNDWKWTSYNFFKLCDHPV